MPSRKIKVLDVLYCYILLSKFNECWYETHSFAYLYKQRYTEIYSKLIDQYGSMLPGTIESIVNSDYKWILRIPKDTNSLIYMVPDSVMNCIYNKFIDKAILYNGYDVLYRTTLRIARDFIKSGLCSYEKYLRNFTKTYNDRNFPYICKAYGKSKVEIAFEIAKILSRHYSKVIPEKKIEVTIF